MFIPPVSGESHTPGFFVFGSAFVSDRWSVFFDGNGRFPAQEGLARFDAQPSLILSSGIGVSKKYQNMERDLTTNYQIII